MSKNVVTVRKPMAERVFICIFSALLLIIVTICVVHLNTPVALLLFVPMLLILLPLLLFSLTWQVRFDEKQIVKVLFFIQTKCTAIRSCKRLRSSILPPNTAVSYEWISQTENPFGSA